MTKPIIYDDDKFTRLLNALSEKERLRSMRKALNQMATRLRAAAISEMPTAWQKNKDLRKGVQKAVWKKKAGFRVHVAANKGNGKGFYRNRRGQLKPVLLWGEDGTAMRATKQGWSRGAMPSEQFLVKGRDRVIGRLDTMYRDSMMTMMAKQALKYGVDIL